MTYSVEHNALQKIFLIKDGDSISRLSYAVINNTTLDYYSTFVPPELRGKGIAEILTRFALDYAREHHCKVRPSCSYVKTFMDRHTEYNDLLA